MKIKNLFLLIAGTAILSSCGNSINTNAQIKTEVDSISYVLGVDIANNMKTAGIEDVNYDAFANGVYDVFEEAELKIKKEEIKPLIQKFFTELRAEKQKEMEAKKGQNLIDGRAFLEENKQKDGIIVTESGLQYEIIKEGTGKSPIATDVVKCHYHGTSIDGTVFDSSVERGEPAEFPLNRVIKGWTEGVQLMKEGAKYKFYIPTEIGYGEKVNPGGKIEPNMALIFEIELLEVMAPKVKEN